MKKFLCVLTTMMCALAHSAEAPASPAFFELRTYHTHPGKLEALLARFRDHTCALFEKHGMTNVGYWTPSEQPDTLVYLLGYPSPEAREEAWKAFRADADWKAAYAESTRDGKLVAKVDSLFLRPTDFSPALQIQAQQPTRLFELRIYTTNEGKLNDLKARFRDHTVALFEQHGITNIAYFTPVKEEDGAALKLVYFVAHPDEAGRKAAFQAFSKDPAWQAAKAKSEENGKLLIEDGVSSTFLTPTDFSPLK